MGEFKTSIVVDGNPVEVTVNGEQLAQVQNDPAKVDISTADRSACGDIPEGEQCDNFLKYDVTGRQISGALVFPEGTDGRSVLRSICTWVPAGRPNPDLLKPDRFFTSLFTPLADRCVNAILNKAILKRGEKASQREEKATVIEPLRVHPQDILKSFVIEVARITGEPLIRLVEGINAQAVRGGFINSGGNIFAGPDQDIANGLKRLAQVAEIVDWLEEAKQGRKNQEVLDLAAKMPKGNADWVREDSWLAYVKDEIVSRWAERHSELFETGNPLSNAPSSFLRDPTISNLVILVRYVNAQVAGEDASAAKAAVTGTYKGEPPKWDEKGGALTSVSALKTWLVNVVKLQENMTMPDLIKRAGLNNGALSMSIYELRDALDAVRDEAGYNAIREKLAAAAATLPKLPLDRHEEMLRQHQAWATQDDLRLKKLEEKVAKPQGGSASVAPLVGGTEFDATKAQPFGAAGVGTGATLTSSIEKPVAKGMKFTVGANVDLGGLSITAEEPGASDIIPEKKREGKASSAAFSDISATLEWKLSEDLFLKFGALLGDGKFGLTLDSKYNDLLFGFLGLGGGIKFFPWKQDLTLINDLNLNVGPELRMVGGTLTVSPRYTLQESSPTKEAAEEGADRTWTNGFSLAARFDETQDNKVDGLVLAGSLIYNSSSVGEQLFTLLPDQSFGLHLSAAYAWPNASFLRSIGVLFSYSLAEKRIPSGGRSGGINTGSAPSEADTDVLAVGPSAGLNLGGVQVSLMGGLRRITQGVPGLDERSANGAFFGVSVPISLGE